MNFGSATVNVTYMFGVCMPHVALRVVSHGHECGSMDILLDAYFVVDENLTGFLSGTTDADTVRSVIGGIGCGE